MFLLFFGGFLFFFRATAWVNTGAGSETRKHRPRRELTQRLDRFLFLSFFFNHFFIFLLRLLRFFCSANVFVTESSVFVVFFFFFGVCVCLNGTNKKSLFLRPSLNGHVSTGLFFYRVCSLFLRCLGRFR